MPDGLTAEQLEVAAFVEEYWESYALAVDSRQPELVREKQADDCECRRAADSVAEVVSWGGQRRGGDIRVVRVLEVYGDFAAGDAQVLYEGEQAAGTFEYPDRAAESIPEKRSTRLLAAERQGGEWLVRGVITTSTTNP